MKGKLNENGLLLVERKGEYVTQLCPYTSFRHDGGSSAMGCGHWCPLFGEPDFTETPCKYGESKPDGGAHLGLCQTHYYFEQFTDERGKK